MANSWHHYRRLAVINRIPVSSVGTTITASSREVPMLSESLRQRLLDFRSDRDWEQFHNLRTLSTSIMLEAAELAEVTQWTRDMELTDVASNRRTQIEHEVADIFILLTYLVNDLGIDVEAVVERKIKLNAEKYPVDRAKGTARKYDEL
jgi:NTP pyrophosphatase (non-canonical NTP hydrolase)